MNDRMKKVCHLTSVHFRYDNRILKRECVSLAENGYDVSLVVNDDRPDEVFRKVNIMSTGLSNNGNRLKRICMGVAAVYKKGLEVDADVYHIHDPELLLVATRLKRRGKRVVFDSHELYTIQIKNKSYLPRLVREAIAKVYYKYETYISKRIDGVIVPFPIERSGVDNKYSFVGRSRVIGYVNNYPRKEEINYRSRDYLNVNRTICYTGSLTYERGIKHIIQAAKKTNVKLYLAGKFSPVSFKEEMTSIIDNKNIIYEGYLDIEELNRIYCDSYIGMCTLLPVGQYDKAGNLSTKVYEYMGMGMPIIISDFPYNRKFIDKYQVGVLVNPNSVEDIANKVDYILSHPKIAQEMGELGRRVFIKKYNWDAAERVLLKVYQSLFKE